MPGRIEVRRGVAADLPEVGRILEQTPEAAQWTPEGFDFFVAEAGGAIAGFLVWRFTAPDEVEILNLAVDPPKRRSGFAKALISALQRATHQPTLFLEVRESNSAARALYSQAGFLEAGVRQGYYQRPQEAAIVMRLQS
jgi:[ribosomal protein S18]-alanine N-acetyltransferase